MFGCEAKMGLGSSNLPKEIKESISTAEEELEKALKEMVPSCNAEKVIDTPSVEDIEATARNQQQRKC